MRVAEGALAWGSREPGRFALTAGDVSVTYGELRERVLAIARALAPLLDHVSPGPVALRLSDPAEFLVAFLGITEAGGIAAPLDPHWSALDVDSAVATCGIRFCIGEPGERSARARLLSMGELQAAAGADGEPGIAAGTDDPFYVGFSSGSSGRPKAIVRNHRAWLNSFLAMTAEFGVGPGAQVGVPGSPFYSFSLIAALQALYVGATVMVPARPGIGAVLDLLERGASVLYALPSLLADITRAALRRSMTLPGVAEVICAGEQLHPSVRAAAGYVFPAADILEYYGASELGFVTVASSAAARNRPDSVGRPFLGTQVAVLGEDGTERPPGEVGLLCARTEYGCAGYYGEPERDASLAHHGWQTVGDLAWRDEAGYVYLTGRRDNMVVIHGENVYPEEVERVLLALPGVAEAAVVAQPADRPTHLVALIVARGPETDATTIIDRCRERLAPRKVPRRVLLVGKLPKTANGKLARAALSGLVTRRAMR